MPRAVPLGGSDPRLAEVWESLDGNMIVIACGTAGLEGSGEELDLFKLLKMVLSKELSLEAALVGGSSSSGPLPGAEFSGKQER